jgi:hypothetical protein
MEHQYYPPKFDERQFHCPLCNVFASQSWYELLINRPNEWVRTAFMGSFCSHCRKWSFWYDGRLMVPNASPVEPKHHDLPADCQADYEEARDIVSRSPRGAVALLRLCLQKLMPYLGEEGKNINDDIKSLVEKGLPPMVQQALDVCRVVGNNAVHPGELDIHDTPEIAHQLFRMINFIVADRITRPKEIQALYAQLPQGAIDAIAKRDGSK